MRAIKASSIIVRRRFREMKSYRDVYYTIVVEEVATSTVVGAGSLIVEKKFTRGLSQVGASNSRFM